MKPPKFTVRLLQAAEDDFKEIITYIALDHLSAAEALADKVGKTLANLTAHPLLGKSPMKKN